MATQKEVVFSARDNGVENTISRIRESANQLGRDLVREASANSSSAKDALKYYEDQIRAIERRNRVEAQSAKLDASRRRDIGLERAGQDPSAQKQVQQQYRTSLNQISKGSREDQIQIELLRELINEVKGTSKDELRSDKRRESSNKIHQERLQLREGNEFEDIGYRLRHEKGSSQSQSSRTSMGGFDTNNVADVLGQTSAGGAVGGALGSLSSKIPAAGLAYAAFRGTQAVWGARSDQELQLRELAGLTGTSIESLMGRDVGGTDMGMYGPVSLNVSREEFRTKVAPGTARAYGTTEGLFGPRGLVMQGLEVQKGMGVGAETVHSLEKMTRTVLNSGNAQGQANRLYNRLETEGAFGAKGNDMSRMQDIMASFVELQSSSFMRHGEMTSSSALIDIMGRFESLGGAYKNDQYKASTIGSLNRGLSQTGSPEANAIKLGILRQLNPEKGLFSLESEMEKGYDSEGFLEGLLNYVQNTGGTADNQKRLLYNLTGGQVRRSDISRMVDSGSFAGTIGATKGSRDFDFGARAEAASSKAATTSAWANEVWDDIKVNIFDTFRDEVTNPLSEAITKTI